MSMLTLALTSVIVAQAPAPAPAPAPVSAPEPAPVAPPRNHYRPFELSLFTPANIFHPPNKVVTGLSLTILYGKNPKVYGLEIGAGLNRETDTMGGLQISATGNWVQGRQLGLAFAGGANVADRAAGAQIAGFFNSAKKLRGLQLSPIANVVVEDGKGVQIGFLNHVRHDFDGLQIALFIWNNFLMVERSRTTVGNTTYVENDVYTWSGSSHALQISAGNIVDKLVGGQIGAVGNVARGGLRGVQIGGLFNGGGAVLEGMQLGGFNGAGRVEGLQLGGMNFARELKGVQIGFINVATRNKVPFMVGMLIGNGKAVRSGKLRR